MSIKTKSLNGAQKVIQIYRPSTWREKGWLWRILMVILTLAIFNFIVLFWWSSEPAQFDIDDASQAYLDTGEKPVVGSAVTGTTIKIIDTLLHKPGGFIFNDKLPPGVMMDNIPSWEYGVLTLVRETTLTLRNEFGRSQSQGAQNKLLEQADGLMRIQSTSWMFPSAESKYDEAEQKLKQYAKDIANPKNETAQFYARADNLVAYLDLVSKSLGGLTQQLGASVGDVVMDTDQQSSDTESSTKAPLTRNARTPWMKIDNIFYEARGYSWALLHELKAVRRDFAKTLKSKNAMASLDQIISGLSKTQKTVWSPMILNGRGFGFTANHSLVMASYLSRANAAILDLKLLLKNG